MFAIFVAAAKTNEYKYCRCFELRILELYKQYLFFFIPKAGIYNLETTHIHR